MHTVLFPTTQVVVLLIGTLIPLVGYVLNKYAPWASETVKGIVQVVLAAIAGGLYTALDTGHFGWNNITLQLVLTAVIAALGAHSWLWKPSGVNAKLGGNAKP